MKAILTTYLARKKRKKKKNSSSDAMTHDIVITPRLPCRSRQQCPWLLADLLHSLKRPWSAQNKSYVHRYCVFMTCHCVRMPMHTYKHRNKSKPYLRSFGVKIFSYENKKYRLFAAFLCNYCATFQIFHIACTSNVYSCIQLKKIFDGSWNKILNEKISKNFCRQKMQVTIHRYVLVFLSGFYGRCSP